MNINVVRLVSIGVITAFLLCVKHHSSHAFEYMHINSILLSLAATHYRLSDKWWILHNIVQNSEFTFVILSCDFKADNVNIPNSI